MFSVNTNLSAMAALQSLNATAAELSKTQNAISTGKRVSQASDNPAVYTISQSMNADLAGLSAVSDSLGFGQAAVTMASNSAKSISDQLTSLKNTVTEGQTSGIDAATMNAQITNILTNINQIAASSTINGMNLLDGTSGDAKVVEDIKGTTLTLTNQNTTAAGLGLSNLATNASAINLTFDNTFAVANADKVTLSDGTKNYVFEFSDGSAPLTTTPDTNTQVFAVQVDPATMSNMQMVGALIDNLHKQGFGATLNSDGSLDIAGNGVTAAASSETFASTGVTQSTVTGAQAAITVVDSAIQQMGQKTAALGAAAQQIMAMQDFTSSLSDSLTSGLGALTDADMAAESAKLQSLQTKQQLAVQALSIANQQPQSLLSLFR